MSGLVVRSAIVSGMPHTLRLPNEHARLKVLGVDTIVIEKKETVGQVCISFIGSHI